MLKVNFYIYVFSLCTMVFNYHYTRYKYHHLGEYFFRTSSKHRTHKSSLIFTPNPGEIRSNLTVRIFFRWVGELNHQAEIQGNDSLPGDSKNVTFLGWLSDPFKWLSDLQLGDQKVTLNHLVTFYCLIFCLGKNYGSSPPQILM